MPRLIGFLAVAAVLMLGAHGRRLEAMPAPTGPAAHHGHVRPQPDRSAPAEETFLVVADDDDPDRREAYPAPLSIIEPAAAAFAPSTRLSESPTLQPPGFRKAPTATRAPPRHA